MFEEGGASIGAILVIHDETERRLSEERLKDADRRKDNFLATLAHELRNPLAPISTGLELMRRLSGNPKALEEIRARMERQAKQIVRLVDDLLDVSRITQGKLSLKKERTDLCALAREIADGVETKIQDAQMQLGVNLPAEACYVDADPHRLAQVITNLIDNSVKFTPPGGRITLEVTLDRQQAKICVRDSGVGIPQELQSAIFGMFTQLTSGQSLYGGKGLGIGLALSKSLMEMHGGGITVRSEGKDQGSEFELTLPLGNRDTPLSSETRVGSSNASTNGAKKGSHQILVVDDNRDARIMLGRLLEMLGHSVRMASDGAQAVEAAKAWRPEVIFMDIGMPVLNGHEAAKRIRQEEWGRNMVLVATTGWAQEQDRSTSRESGFDHHLVKPVNLASIEQVLSKVSAVSSAPHAN
jgi:CheY-like chemotaxis protein